MVSAPLGTLTVFGLKVDIAGIDNRLERRGQTFDNDGWDVAITATFEAVVRNGGTDDGVNIIAVRDWQSYKLWARMGVTFDLDEDEVRRVLPVNPHPCRYRPR